MDSEKSYRKKTFLAKINYHHRLILTIHRDCEKINTLLIVKKQSNLFYNIIQ